MATTEWPDFECPRCSSDVWLSGFADTTTVDGEGDYREVHHCGVCELVVVRQVSRDDRPRGYTAEPRRGKRAFPRGPLGHVESGPAIGFCPRCGTNARRACAVRGIFDCPYCTFQWLDDRVGEQERSIDDYFCTA